MFNANPSRVGGYEAMNELLLKKPRLKAAVCYNDVTAFGALSALGEKGLRAGLDFALMGFDNILDTAHSNPPLSTVDIHPTELGERAAAILLQRINDPDAKRMVYTAPASLLLRQTA
jgi:LacI family transcriptional regulator